MRSKVTAAAQSNLERLEVALAVWTRLAELVGCSSDDGSEEIARLRQLLVNHAKLTVSVEARLSALEHQADKTQLRVAAMQHLATSLMNTELCDIDRKRIDQLLGEYRFRLPK